MYTDSLTEAQSWDIKSTDNLFAHCYNNINEHPNRLFRLSFPFENNKFCVFSIKKFELHGNQLFLTEIVNLNHRENHQLYKNRYYVAKQVWNNWEQIQCVVHSPLIVGMTIALLVSLGTCIVQKQNVRVNFACKKVTFQSLGRSDYQCPHFGSVCQVLLKIK